MNARVLVAKPGLDGHDRGAKIVARTLRDAGFEVIYTGIRQEPALIARMAAQEDVDIVGLSILSGAHIALTRSTVAALKEANVDHAKIIVGGTVPEADIAKLKELGAADVFPTGTRMDDLVSRCRALVEDRNAAAQ